MIAFFCPICPWCDQNHLEKPEFLTLAQGIAQGTVLCAEQNAHRTVPCVLSVSSATDAAAPQLDSSVLKLTGNPEGEKTFTQTLNLAGNEGDAFVLAGWAKGSSVPLRGDRAFGMELTFHYTEAVSNPKQQKVDFNPDTDDWGQGDGLREPF